MRDFQLPHAMVPARQAIIVILGPRLQRNKPVRRDIIVRLVPILHARQGLLRALLELAPNSHSYVNLVHIVLVGRLMKQSAPLERIIVLLGERNLQYAGRVL